MVVLSGGIDDQFRLEFLQDGKYQIVHNIMYARIRCLWRHRYVNGGAVRERAAQLSRETGTRIERPSVLMERYEKHVGVMPEYLLRTVAMMYIGIHNCETFDAIGAAQVFHHDGLIIDITETPVAMYHGHGVMTRRPYYRKCILYLALHEGIGHHHC